jgi:hypothetical protein
MMQCLYRILEFFELLARNGNDIVMFFARSVESNAMGA